MKSRLQTSLRYLTIMLVVMSCGVHASAAGSVVHGPISTDEPQKVMLPLVVTNYYRPSTTIVFDRYPDGTPITTDTILNGDEFLSLGIRLAGAPESSYCEGATATAILAPPHHVGAIDITFLTSSEPDGLNCHAVPVEITFVQVVRQVTLVFAGSSVDYTMRVYDSAGTLLGAVDQQPVWGGGVFEVSYTSASTDIARVTFGRELAITAVKEMRYAR